MIGDRMEIVRDGDWTETWGPQMRSVRKISTVAMTATLLIITLETAVAEETKCRGTIGSAAR